MSRTAKLPTIESPGYLPASRAVVGMWYIVHPGCNFWRCDQVGGITKKYFHKIKGEDYGMGIVKRNWINFQVGEFVPPHQMIYGPFSSSVAQTLSEMMYGRGDRSDD